MKIPETGKAPIRCTGDHVVSHTPVAVPIHRQAGVLRLLGLSGPSLREFWHRLRGVLCYDLAFPIVVW